MNDTASPRIGHISVAGRTLMIQQAAGVTFSAAGLTWDCQLKRIPDCPWAECGYYYTCEVDWYEPPPRPMPRGYVQITEANVEENRIRVTLGPPSAGLPPALFRWELKKADGESFTLIQETLGSGYGTYNFRFEDLPDGTYTSLVATWYAALQTHSVNINLRAPICSGGENDQRTKIVRDYRDWDAPNGPRCSDLTQTLPAVSRYPIGISRQQNSWNRSNSFGDWAWLKPGMLTNVECILNAYGATPTLNSGYRTPTDQMSISTISSEWENARHVYGDAADLSAVSDATWQAMREIAKSGDCTVACVEPREIAPTHLHVDYNRPSGSCPNTRW